MTELYEFPPTRSQRAKWALEELGVEYSSQLINLGEGQQNSEHYRAIHPLGVVPALKTSNYTIVGCDRAATDRRTPGEGSGTCGWIL